MLLSLKRRIADGLWVALDVAGVALSGSGAAVVTVFGKALLAVVLGAIALGFFLRLAGRRRERVVVASRISAWARVASAGLAAVEVALLVEATNLPVRFNQTGFEPWHWIVVLAALVVTYPLNLRVLGRLMRRRSGALAP